MVFSAIHHDKLEDNPRTHMRQLTYLRKCTFDPIRKREEEYERDRYVDHERSQVTMT